MGLIADTKARDKALKTIAENKQRKMVLLYYSELNRRSNGLGLVLKTLLTDEEFELLKNSFEEKTFKYIDKVDEMYNNVTRATKRLQASCIFTNNLYSMTKQHLTRWADLEAMELAVNMGLQGIPNAKERRERARLIVDTLRLSQCRATLDPDSYLQIDISNDGNADSLAALIGKDKALIAYHTAVCKGAIKAIRDFLLTGEVDMPATLVFLEKQEEMLRYAFVGWEKFVNTHQWEPNKPDEQPSELVMAAEGRGLLYDGYRTLPIYDWVEPDTKTIDWVNKEHLKII